MVARLTSSGITASSYCLCWKIKWRIHVRLAWKACVLYSLFTAPHSMSLSLKDFPSFQEGLGGHVCNCSVKLSLEKSPAARLAAWLSGSELTEGQSGKRSQGFTFFFFLFVFFSIVSFNTCGAVLLTIPTSEIGENLKPLRGVRKKCLWERKKKRKRERKMGVCVKCEREEKQQVSRPADTE